MLARHWPDAKRHGDVRFVGARNLARVEVICGGFPCQDISFAGLGAGLAGDRSGLWWEFHRIVKELRPAAVVVENVAALRSRGLALVRAALRDLGYRVVVVPLSCAEVGAPHERARLFILAIRRSAPALAHPDRCGGRVSGPEEREGAGRPVALGARALDVADANGDGRERLASRDGVATALDLARGRDAHGRGDPLPDAHGERRGQCDEPGIAAGPEVAGPADAGRRLDDRAAQPLLGGMPHGVSRWVERVRERHAGGWPAPPGQPPRPWEPPRTAANVRDRGECLEALGNAVSPVAAEAVGLFLLELLDEERSTSVA